MSHTSTGSRLLPDDLLRAIALCQRQLASCLDADWTVPAGDLTWDCRRTLDHMVNALALYAAHLASRATERLPVPRNGDPSQSVAALLALLGAMGSVLAEVARAAPPETRAFHPAGMADVPGFLAMGCTETLIHTHDIMLGLSKPFQPPDQMVRPVLRRLFPWAPTSDDAWAVLLWATGRTALPDRDRLGPDWYWHCAPLQEWDGTMKRRTAPPAWE